MRAVETTLASHERVCTERWAGTFFRITRMERFIIATLCTVIIGGAGVMGTLFIMLKDAVIR